MALANYTDLNTTVASYIHRTNQTSQIVDYITLAEAKLNRNLRLRLMESDESVTLTSGTRTIALPARYIEPISLCLVISGRPNDYLTLRTPAQLAIDPNSSAAKQPRYYAINGSNIEFPNLSDATYSMTFRMLKGFDLASTTTNVLLTNYPDLYLFGTLLEAVEWMDEKDQMKIARWQRRYDTAMREVNRINARSKSAAPLMTDIPSISRGGYNINSDQ